MVGRRSFRFGARLFLRANLLLVLGSVISAASLLVEFSQSIHQFGSRISTFQRTEKVTSVGENGFHSDERHHV